MAEHIVEMAKARARIKDGEVEVLSQPLIRRCPLRDDLYGCKEESRNSVERVLRTHLEELGMYGPDKVLEIYERDVSFGASEILSDAMADGLVDAAVVVCEGAGTVIVRRPEVLQAVGAHMTGLLSTDPILEIQRRLEERGCTLLDAEGTIDQVRGYQKALGGGWEKIAVTVAGSTATEAKRVRSLGRGGVTILAVHTTGISRAEAEVLADSCDLVWACASKWVRDIIGRRAKIQIGVSIPVFALTDRGKRLVLNRALHFDKSLVIHRASLPHLNQDRQPEPLI